MPSGTEEDFPIHLGLGGGQMSLADPSLRDSAGLLGVGLGVRRQKSRL